MVWTQAYGIQDDFNQNETTYQTDYARWNGMVHSNPVLRQIIEIRAASVFNSWLCKGSHEKQATKILNDMGGRSGHESFKQIMANLYRIAYICGDAYAEKIYEGDPSEGNIIDLHVLPSDNIRQVVKKGKIIRFEERIGDAKWEPFRIFHVRYNPRGAQTHGLGMVEPMNNLLVSREQIMQIGMEMYERMSKPREILLVNTSDQTKIDEITEAVKAAGDTWSGIAVMPKRLIDSVEDIQLTVSLRPQEFIEVLDKDIFKATATPEIVLGTGYSTSEEDAKTRIAGFMGSIRYDQEDFEEMIRTQIFEEVWPANPPEIEFSYQEAFDDKFNRNMESIPMIDASPTIAPANKDIMIKERLKEMKMIT